MIAVQTRSVDSWRDYWHGVGSVQWRVLLAGLCGWMLDGMDAMLYSFALLPIREEFHLSHVQAGALASVTLLTSIAGVGFGLMADRVGRVKALSYSILAYSLFTGLLATSHSLAELLFWRALVGVGLGGEWAVGSVLVAETWPARHRGKAIGLMQSGWAIGYLLAAALSAVILPRWGWRALFALGALPALATFWIRRSLRGLDDSVPFKRPSPVLILKSVLSGPLLRVGMLATLLTTSLLFAYWGLFTWIPAYLASPVENGGAGLGIVKSATWIIPMQVASFFGYICFGLLSDRYGRRPVFVTFVLTAALVVFVYGRVSESAMLLLFLGPFVGFFGHGYFSALGTLLAELFPMSVRATAQALCYNTGKALSALAPVTVGFCAERAGIGGALGLMALLFAASSIFLFLLPTKDVRELA